MLKIPYCVFRKRTDNQVEPFLTINPLQMTPKSQMSSNASWVLIHLSGSYSCFIGSFPSHAVYISNLTQWLRGLHCHVLLQMSPGMSPGMGSVVLWQMNKDHLTWQRPSHSSEACVPFFLGTRWLTLSAAPTVRCGHAAEFWPMESKLQIWATFGMGLPKQTRKNNNDRTRSSPNI